MGNENEISMADLGAAIIVTLGLVLGLYPVILVFNTTYLWYLFSGALLLLFFGILLFHMKKYKKIGFHLFVLGLGWFVITMLLLCTWIQSPIIAVM